MGSKNIQIRVDFRSDTPIYLQVVDQIRQKVASGELIPGDQLPTVRQLATELRVNWNTIARAYRLLDEAGLISTQQGRGTYIWETLNNEMANKLREQTLEGLTRRYLEECSRLGAKPDEIQGLINSFLADLNEIAPNPKQPEHEG